MDINVSVNKICIANPDILNSGEAYIHKLKFNFSEEYTPDLVYRACFTCLSGTFVSPILNNECEIPPEALEADGTIELGVYAYILQDETLEKRFSPEHLFLTINAGSYREGLESEAPTPTEQEQWLNAFNQNYLEKMQSANEEIEQAKDEAIEEIDKVAEVVSKDKSDIEEMKKSIETSEINAKTSEENAKTSEENAGEYLNEVKNISNAMTFANFEVDVETGELQINTLERFENAGFSVNENGDLEVEISG